MVEYQSDRKLFNDQDRANNGLPISDPSIVMKSCYFTWGYRIKQTKAAETNNEQKSKKGASKSNFKLETEIVTKNVLSDLNLELRKGDFLAVIGQVGCGKSSLLYSIMDETILK